MPLDWNNPRNHRTFWLSVTISRLIGGDARDVREAEGVDRMKPRPGLNRQRRRYPAFAGAALASEWAAMRRAILDLSELNSRAMVTKVVRTATARAAFAAVPAHRA